MKDIRPLIFIVLFTVLLSSCSVIGGIFKAGIWVGVIIVVLVIALVIWIISKIFK